MRALRFHAAGDLRLDEVDEPIVTAGGAKVRVRFCGICGSDVDEYVRGPRVLPRPGRPHPLTGEEPPLTMGHELAGEIVELGEDAGPGLELGRAVAVEPLLSCGACPPCRAGAYHLCRIGGAIGLSGGGGGFSEHVVVRGERLHPLPENLTLEEGAIAEPIAVGMHGLVRAGFGEGQSLLVIGAGPIGLGVVATARALRAGRVAAAVRRPGRRARLASALGADPVLGADGPGWEGEARAAAGGDGFDVVVDAAGTQDSLRSALRCVRRGGGVVNLALWDGPASVNPNLLLAHEISLVGSMAYAGEFAAVLAAMSEGKLGDVAAMISGVLPIENAVRDGFAVLAEGGTDGVKFLVAP